MSKILLKHFAVRVMDAIVNFPKSYIKIPENILSKKKEFEIRILLLVLVIKIIVEQN